MFPNAPVKQVPDCRVCFAPHNDEIHEATVRVHRWFQQQVTKNFWEEGDIAGELVEDQVA